MVTRDEAWRRPLKRGWGSVAITSAALILLLASPGAAGQAAPGQPGPVLTNEDVIKMTRAGLSDQVIIKTIDSTAVAFDVSPAGLAELKKAGVERTVMTAMQRRSVAHHGAAAHNATSAETIARSFKTMALDAGGAVYFKTPALKAALASDPGFADLGLVVVDDPAGADAILEVSYKFAWDYPFLLRDRATGVVLLHGTGTGPFSGPAGAISVAHELVELLRPYRQLPAGAPGGEGLTALVSGLVTPGDIVTIARWHGGNTTSGTVASVTECTLEVRAGTDVESVSLWDIRTLKRQVMSPPDHPVAAAFYGAAATCDDIGCLPGALVVLGVGGLIEVFEAMASPPQVVLYRSAQRRTPPEKCQATLR